MFTLKKLGRPNLAKQEELAIRYPNGIHYRSLSFGESKVVAHIVKDGELFLKLQSVSNDKNVAYLSVLQANPKNITGGV